MTTLPAPLKPGDLGLDAAAPTFSYADAVKNGARFFLRYDAGAGNTSSATQWKLCKPGEIAQIVAAGGDFLANTEWTTDRMLSGASGGAQDGAAALKFWQSRGYARGATILVSADFAVPVSKYPTAAAYAKAYVKGLLGYYDTVVGPGVYGGTPFLKYLLAVKAIVVGWRPNAGSWSNDGIPYQPDTSTATARASLLAYALSRTPARLLQTGNYWYNKDADEDMVLRTPVGSHCDALRAAQPAGFQWPTSGRQAAWFAACLNWAALLGGDRGPVTAKDFPSVVPPAGQGLLTRAAALETQVAALTAEVAAVQAALKPPTFTAQGETQ